MKKFRVLSDLHLDINNDAPIELVDKDIFTILCGDTSGQIDIGIKWVKENIRNGVGISGNHLPYNDDGLEIQKLREKLAAEFPENNGFTYLDCLTRTFSKEVDGILFVGTCMYTDMRISHPEWNPSGDKDQNQRSSAYCMNDYSWGIKKITDTGKQLHISPADYADWFAESYTKIDKLLTENESSENPKPVVLITHHPLITDYFDHNGYMDKSTWIYRSREFNWASYGSNQQHFIIKHPSIKCYCCGHIHDVEAPLRAFDMARADGSRILVVNNARGYVSRGHDANFNVNRFVNVDTWTLEEQPLTDEEKARRKAASDKLLKYAGLFI